MFTHYEDIEGNAKCRNWDGFVAYTGHPRSPTMSPCESAYDFLFDFNDKKA